jgi:hypothetical protein
VRKGDGVLHGFVLYGFVRLKVVLSKKEKKVSWE